MRVPGAKARKTVTVVFADVTGFTALGERLDPESLQHVITRYFAEMRTVIERHGGMVEKFVGDGVMAVFGIPVVHEDDPLRAARAALEMRDALEALNEEFLEGWDVLLRTHTGINTGEVAVGETADGQPLTLGDTVNVAQRLESAAGPGEILVGAQTAGLLRAHTRLTAVEPLRLKGKAALVHAWRLEAAEPGERAAAEPGHPLVGRTTEIQRLRGVFDEVVATRRPAMVTVLGPAGIGKSRLAKELAAAVDQRATVLVGRCLPYGEGITYWPLVEIVRRLTGLPDEAAIAALAGHGQEARRIATRIARLVAIEPGGVAADEAHWAVRRLLEIRATRHPVIVVVDDIHWAEPSLLELLEHVWTFAADVPLLGICLARPDLLERRPGWGERDGAGVMTLGPLAAGDAAALLGTLTEGRGVDADEAARVLTAAEGNPFFLEQMVAMRAEGEGAAAGIPATIQALLAARIDALPAPERAALGSAAVEGRHFHRGAVAEMLPAEERERLDASLAALVRRQLIRPGGAELPGESGFRFAHILVRDVAYELLTKAARADLHQRYAAWLKRRAGTGFAEIVGYHLEKAHRCHAELRPGAEAERAAIGIEAAHHLGGAGRLALGRGDLPAGVNLLERATAVLAADDPERGRLMPDLGMALAQLGRLPHAEEVLVAAARSAALRGARSAEAHALTARFFARVQTDSEAAAADLRRQFDGLRRTFDADGDDLGLARLWRADGLVHWLEGRSADAEVAWMRAVRHARRAGDEHARADALVWIASAARDGPTPVEPAIARCNAIMEQLQADRRSQGLTLRPLAALHAMCGRFAEARALLDRATETFSELGVSMHAAISEDEALVALLCGDAAAAEAALRLSYVHLEQMGERALLANTAGLLAHALCAQGRDADALAFTDVAQAAAAADDLAAQILYRTVRARVLAGRADLAAADRLSSEAVALAERTDWLNDHADALMARAAVLCPMDRQGEAREAIGTAIALYERKGNVVALARARETLEGAVVV